MSTRTRTPSTTGAGAPAESDQELSQRRQRRSAALARRSSRRDACALQSRARPGAQPACQRLRGFRRAQDDGGRQPLHEGRAVSKRSRDEDARALLHGRGRARLAGHVARRARIRAEVLHDGRQLRPRRQQHTGVLPARPDEVSALHPQPETACPIPGCARVRCSGTSGR